MTDLARRKLVEHSIINACVGDVVGTSLDSYEYIARQTVLPSIIKNLKSKPPTSNTSEHPKSKLMLRFLNSLIHTEGTVAKSIEDIAPFWDDSPSTGFAISCAMGYYAALKNISCDDLYAALSKVLTSARILDKAFTANFLVAFLVRTLCDEGYFRSDHIEKFVAQYARKADITPALLYMVKHQFNRQFILKNKPDATLFEGLNYMDAMVVRVVYYMFNTSTCQGKRPKPLMLNMVEREMVSLSDFLFLFSAVCTASEHHYLLFTAPVQDKIIYTPAVRRLMGRV